MDKLLRHSISVLLIFGLGCSALMYVSFGVRQIEYKEEAQQNIKSNTHLPVLQLSLEEFRKNRQDDELWMNGKLYDISGYTISNETVTVTVLHDEQEESLVKSMVSSFEPNDTYITDKIVHAGKHKIHPPSDQKILSARYSLAFTDVAPLHEAIPYYVMSCASPVFEAVIKPPGYIAA